MSPDLRDRELAALAADHEFSGKTGLLPSRWDEIRRFPRFYLRGPAQAWVHPPHGSHPQERTRMEVLTCDVSRAGLGIICPRLLYPEQRLDIQVAGGQEFRVKVIWCRRQGANHFAAGCTFLVTASAGEAAE